MKRGEEAMEILEAYDATGSLRRAAALAGCDHKTVARLVAARDAAGGGLPERARSRPLVDPFAGKIDELVDRSSAHIRADKAHGLLVAMGYEGSYRTTRRAVAEASAGGATSTGGGPGRGSRSRGCGCSGTTATGPRSPGRARCCSARGWRGRGFGSWCRCETGRCRRW